MWVTRPTVSTMRFHRVRDAAVVKYRGALAVSWEARDSETRCCFSSCNLACGKQVETLHPICNAGSASGGTHVGTSRRLICCSVGASGGDCPCRGLSPDTRYLAFATDYGAVGSTLEMLISMPPNEGSTVISWRSSPMCRLGSSRNIDRSATSATS